MNFIKKNSKHILMGLTLSFFVLMLGLGLGLSAFGMGMESQRFITSVDKVIDKYIPKGKVVLNGKGQYFDTTYVLLRKAYEDDVQSTLTLEKQNDEEVMNFWKLYADTKFDQQWKSKIDNKEDIDINEFSHAVVQFDIEIAKQFHNYAFTHSGLGWIRQKKVLSQLWGSNFANTALYQEAQQDEIILDQAEYKAGTYIVNNKVAFINKQLQQVTVVLEIPDMFKDSDSVRNTLMKNENDTQVPVQISVDDLYHPNYTKMFQQTRIGAIFLIILTPIFGIVFIASSLVGYSVLLKMNWSRNLLNKMRINKARV
ncbi:hypothetical protein LT335_00571 [Spiroplasma sp. JKS002669]|uniref:hypothetical protein n=1 Tax=Spiroplasma attinicola TaxID=2904537 RepID=UPI0020BE8754|nr:hypothetical protein [Spiroplasma sp. JKS002669]MCL6429010.1 hypothetical protein [Spiroplasma sp. JKS002669]